MSVVSDKILPIRFYDSLYDQNRFNIHCYNNCQFDLVYPASKLPHFQLKRKSIFALPSSFYLRNVCTDAENNNYVNIPKGADTFCNPELSKQVWTNSWKEITGFVDEGGMGGSPIYGPNNILKADCCSLENVFNNPNFIPNLVTTLPYSYTVKRRVRICVDKFISTAGFQIKVWNDTWLKQIITSAGIYEFDYLDNGTGDFHLEFFGYVAGDYFKISEIQIWTDYTSVAMPTDIALDPTSLKLLHLKDGTDIISYCQPISYTSNIPDGEYYYIILSGSDVYFSEVFKIVSLKKLEKHYKLTWYSDCDFNNSVIYNSSTISCNFRNELYLSAGLDNDSIAGLIKPEYDTIEESETNGQGDISVKYRRWQKNISFEIGKCPLFITDALSAVFLHKNIILTEPLNLYQDNQSQITVLKTTSEIADILHECFQRVVLKLLLEDKITNTKCCNEPNFISCDPCDYSATNNVDTCTSYYVETIDGNGTWWTVGCTTVPRYSMTLKDCNGNIIIVSENQIICLNGLYYQLKYYKGKACDGVTDVEFWYASLTAPTIVTAAFAFIGFYITGQLIPNTYGKAYFQINCTGAWILADTFSVDSTGNYTFLYTAALLTPYLPFTSICFKVDNVTQNCDFGYTNVKCVGAC